MSNPRRRYKEQQKTRATESKIKARAKKGTQQGKALAKQQAAKRSSSAKRSAIRNASQLYMGAIPQAITRAAKFVGGTGKGYQPNIPTPPKTKHHSSNPVNRPRH